jgi:hypothetical protein
MTMWRMRRARRVVAGLTEEVGRRWGSRERPARRRSGGGRLRWCGGILGGGPTARGAGEGGDCGRGVGAGRKARRGGKIFCPAAGSSTLLKGGGRNTAEGGSWVTRGVEWGRERGPRCGGKWLERQWRAAGRR